MIIQRYIHYTVALLCCIVQTTGIAIYGQDRPRAELKRMHQLQMADSVVNPTAADSLKRGVLNTPQTLVLQTDSLTLTKDRPDSLQQAIANQTADSIAKDNKQKMMELTANPDLEVQEAPTDSLDEALTKKQWLPNPTKATWLALVIPGGGQIYNRKYWKLPIFYGGFAGCAYALTWNGKMYKDYSNAYRDAVNGNFNSSSITDLLPPGYMNNFSESQLTETLRRRKDTYRRWRDLSIFAFIAVYLVSVIDAYVDAELSNFDISPDLSMKVEPTIINNQSKYAPTRTSPLDKSVGVQCKFSF